MKKHNVHRARKTAAASAVKPLPWGTVILTLICASVLAGGFFYAARQHFSTIDLGLKNSKLRQQVEDLESERRRLVLAREVSMSPVNIARVAREVPPKLKPGAIEPVEQETAMVEKKQETSMIEKKDLAKPATETVQISMREAKKNSTPIRGPETRRSTKPKPESAAERSSSPNERPRVIETEKRVASAAVRSF